jgi:hypothetical protein
MMKLRKFRPAVHGMGAWPFFGTGLLFLAAMIEGNAAILMRPWPVWILILGVPLLNTLAYLGFRYLHLTQKIKSDSRRKEVTHLIRYWIWFSTRTNLLYAEIEGEENQLAYLACFFLDIPDFQVRLEMSRTEDGRKLNILKIFSDKMLLKDLGSKAEVLDLANLPEDLNAILDKQQTRRQKRETNEKVH